MVGAAARWPQRGDSLAQFTFRCAIYRNEGRNKFGTKRAPCRFCSCPQGGSRMALLPCILAARHVPVHFA